MEKDNKNESISQEIVDAIVFDFTDRRGLRQQWEGIDDEIQQEIKDAWKEKIINILNNQ